MYYCTQNSCINPKAKKAQCYRQDGNYKGKKCEAAKFGCPKCHSDNIHQSENGYWLVCGKCGYKEFDD